MPEAAPVTTTISPAYAGAAPALLLLLPVYLGVMFWIVPRLLDRVATRLTTRDGLSNSGLAIVGGVAVASALVAQVIGLEYILGAFIAGVAIPAALRRATLDRIEIVTMTLLMPFFFTLTGLHGLHVLVGLALRQAPEVLRPAALHRPAARVPALQVGEQPAPVHGLTGGAQQQGRGVLGGGVVGDAAGFAAATYRRGGRMGDVPTTRVAQVDSAIGGKTGVDVPEGKNLVGAFHPPTLVIVDPDMRRTLPHREYRSGLYEVVKYGVIADAKLFEFLEEHMNAVLRRDAAALDWIIPRCIAIKARVVTKDEREAGLRKILNFGHTLGHALEAATGYKRFLHGEAIAWGMMAATLLAVARNRTLEAEGSIPSQRSIFCVQR